MKTGCISRGLRRRAAIDKKILYDYIDACRLIKETEADICWLKKKRNTVIQTNVKGSNPRFPYQEQHFKVQGTAFTYQDDGNLRLEEMLLEQRRENAEKIKRQVEEWMLTIPIRMQRIIRYKIFEERTWERVATLLHARSGESVRKEFERFMEKV